MGNEPGHLGAIPMADQTISPEANARQVIERCRREIQAAWDQINAARELLKGTRWMLTRWAEQSAAIDRAHLPTAAPGRSEAAREGMFVAVGPDLTRHRRRRKRGGASA
jgi:hypothetical protein